MIPTIRDRIVELRRVPADQLIASPKNWRTHPAAQRLALGGLMEEIGFADVLLVRETPDGLVLIDGHLRAEEVGSMDVPVVVLDLNEEEADKLILTLDPLAGMAGADAEALTSLLASVTTESDAVQAMFDDLAKTASALMPPKEGETDPDAVPDVPKEPTAKRGDLYLLGDHRLLCGDATDAGDVARLMGEEKADMVWGDPPYGIALDTPTADRRRGYYGGTAIDEVNAPWDGRLISEWVPLWEAVTAAGGYLASWHPYQGIGQIEQAALACGLIWLNLFTWVKENPAPGFPEYLAKSCEHASIFRKDGKGRYVGPELVRDYAVSPVTPQADRHGHPSPKRIDVVEPILGKLVRAGGLIADPFVGSGTTIIAAERQGRRCYAMEIEPAYVDVCVRRWEQYTGEKAEREKRR